jgi:hypothetical protein
MKDLFATNWEQELTEGDLATRREGEETFQVVLLTGLQRLARQAGLVAQRVQIITPAPTMVQAVFTSSFQAEVNGVTTTVEFVGAADCNKGNTKGRYADYPTAVAESRAEARSLRKALGIRMLSSEEVGFREGVGALEASPGGKAAGSLVAAIENLCSSRGIDVVQALGVVLPDERASAIFELSELRTDEAQAVMAWLNEQKPQAPSKRTARKAELQAKQEK